MHPSISMIQCINVIQTFRDRMRIKIFKMEVLFQEKLKRMISSFQTGYLKESIKLSQIDYFRNEYLVTSKNHKNQFNEFENYKS